MKFINYSNINKLFNNIYISKLNFKLLIVLFVLSTYISFGQTKKQSTSFEDGVNYLSQFIASNEFEELTLNCTDLDLVDTLYSSAINFYNGDISEALLALTFSTLPFNKMPVTIPFSNIVLNLRLPSVNQKLFLKKRENIPGVVYFNSPTKGGKDKDKVAHFFGNAFLAYNISIFNASKFLGIIVELFESAFKVSGGVDNRDLYTNYLGEYFGYSLIGNHKLSPSDFFNVYSLFYFSYTW